MEKKLKIAFVVQRYGNEVNGGAELLCRQLVEKMCRYHHVEILTTCAIDYVTWKDEYAEGLGQVNGIPVRRFKVDCERDPRKFQKFSEKIFSSPRTYLEEVQWMWKQGPLCLQLIRYIRENRESYDIFIFVTYLYFTTFAGLQLVPEKSILIPAAHDEAPIYLELFNPIFHLPRALFFNTPEEMNFVHNKFKNHYIQSEIGGIGIEVPENISAGEFKEEHQIDYPYILYVGRIDSSKGCDELFSYFARYKKENPSSLKLLLMGKPVMPIPPDKDIISLGFVSERDKFSGILDCELLVLPSRYESLSIVVLESFKMERPVLINGHSDVVRGHCTKGNAGLYYTNYDEFAECLTLLLNHRELNKKLGENGRRYVDKYYRWEIIEDKLNHLIFDVYYS